MKTSNNSRTAKHVMIELEQYSSPEKKQILQRFFKTGTGEYGEGDIFIGIVVPNIRKVAKKFITLQLPEVQKLLNSKIHEHRVCGLFILTYQFEKADAQKREMIFHFYLKNTKYINNWDLVDLSAPNIVGEYLLDKPRDILYKLARSSSLWERRIAILATFAFIKRKECKDIIALAKILLHDNRDLMHKAVGWMLREMGKRADEKRLYAFLDEYAAVMPRTMLRYAIERLPEQDRQAYLAKKQKTEN